jgi:hypothetical protein
MSAGLRSARPVRRGQSVMRAGSPQRQLRALRGNERAATAPASTVWPLQSPPNAGENGRRVSSTTKDQGDDGLVQSGTSHWRDPRDQVDQDPRPGEHKTRTRPRRPKGQPHRPRAPRLDGAEPRSAPPVPLGSRDSAPLPGLLRSRPLVRVQARAWLWSAESGG